MTLRGGLVAAFLLTVAVLLADLAIAIHGLQAQQARRGSNLSSSLAPRAVRPKGGLDHVGAGSWWPVFKHIPLTTAMF